MNWKELKTFMEENGVKDTDIISHLLGFEDPDEWDLKITREFKDGYGYVCFEWTDKWRYVQ